ncbi:hypothetical protein MRX96_050113 [Rhipicephalus microplus]
MSQHHRMTMAMWKQGVHHAQTLAKGMLAMSCGTLAGLFTCAHMDNSTPQFRDTKILARHKERKTREIMEAAEIARLKDQCVSRASVTLSQKEMDFLSVG